MILEYSILLVILMIALYTDIKSNTIHNKLSFIGMLLGVVLSMLNGNNIIMSILLCVSYFIVLFYIPRRIGISEFIGAGDIKLYMVITLIMGYKFSIYTFLYSIFIGTPILLLLNIKRMKDISINVSYFFLVNKQNIKDRIDSQKVNIFSPYILVGSIITYLQVFIVNNDWLFKLIDLNFFI